jgi:hypothetical protein
LGLRGRSNIELVNIAYSILLEKYYKMTVSKRIRWEVHVANMGRKINEYKVCKET